MKTADLFECHGAWGHPPYPLLPKALRKIIGSHRVEQEILKSEGLPFDTNYSIFDQSVWGKVHSIKGSTAQSLRFLFSERFNSIENDIVFDLSRYDRKSLERLPLSTRAINVLRREYPTLSNLAVIHYRDIFKLPNLGLNSVLEIACVMEYLECPEDIAPRQIMLDMFDKNQTVSNSSQKGPFENFTLRLEGSLDLSRDLVEVLRCCVSPEQVEKLGLRYGWLGEDPKTLEEVGQRYGVTRERIRQIEAKFEKKLLANKIRIRSLDESILFLKNSVVLRKEDANKLILEKGLTTKPVSVEGIVKHAAILFANNNDLEIATVDGCKFVCVQGASKLIELINHEANAEVSRYGCGNVDEIIEEVSNRFSTILSKDIVVKVLNGFEDVIFLDKVCNWFWCETKRNRLLNGLRKIFSVTDQLEVTQIREGLQRSYRQRSLRLVPSKEAILEVCKLLPNFYVDGTLVGVYEKFNQNEVLSEIERSFLKVLSKSEDGVLTRNDVLDRVQELGISDVSGSGYLSWSPILEQVAVNLWGIRGGEIDPVKIKHLTEINLFKPKPSIKSDWGWTPNRSLFIVYRLNKSYIRSGVFPLFSGMSHYLTEKNYALVDVQNEKVGVLGIKDDGSACWGMGGFLRRVDADENDYLILDIDLQKNIANIKIGGYELVSEF